MKWHVSDSAHPEAVSQTAKIKASTSAQVEIMMALEEEFDIDLDEDNAEKISTVQEAADLIEENLKA
jgi:acyl carrier protein